VGGSTALAASSAVAATVDGGASKIIDTFETYQLTTGQVWIYVDRTFIRVKMA
jgi:hypothetical protein